ncbi:MAG: ATP-dependent helicase [Dehalococcoidia bacterium]|nr:ATP-dependent helicase [Dehalococcoidia bacterium]
MNLDQLLDRLRATPSFRDNLTAWRLSPPREAAYTEWPASLDPRLATALASRGITHPYSHQASAIEAILDGRDVVVVTATASGKTLCYNVPVLQSILDDSASRSLYLFPTKALSQDQYSELHGLIRTLGLDIKTYTYDGDTPASARRAVRLAGHIVISNPDMLHTGILPHHTKWQRLFENLRYIVVDELHHYRGIFGSHVANVLRRLLRVCAFYESTPRIICCSATIANPSELARSLTGRPFETIDNDGAPRGGRHFIFYNPPPVNRELGIRKSAVTETANLATQLLRNDIQTIVFARSRVRTEVLLTAIRRRSKLPKGQVRGYRGGYRPLQRREIEGGLRSGDVRGVVATNALELGIDIGQLDAAILCGYPGTIASTWQQSGRAGRRATTSVAIFVATSAPLAQFVVTHPDYFFERSPEHGLINADNLYLRMNHLACAAFELPFEDSEQFGTEGTGEALGMLEHAGVLQHEGDSWYWTGEDYPAEAVSLRSAQRENVVIVDVTGPQPQVLGECDPFDAPMLVHEDAIYLHEGQQYHIVEFDWEQKRAHGKRVNVDFYTDASLGFNVAVLQDEGRDHGAPLEQGYGEVRLASTPTIYKKIRMLTGENVGWGKIDLPAQEMHTTAYWTAVPEDLAGQLGRQRMQGGVLGLCNLLVNVAPLFLMCDPRDLIAVPQVKNPFTGRATIFLADNYPGGVGFSRKLFQTHETVFEAARQLAQDCGCEDGCPSCTGPQDEIGEEGKEGALMLLAAALQQPSPDKSK